MNKCNGCSADFTADELHIHIGSVDNYQCREKYTPIERDRLLKAHVEFRKMNKPKGKEEDKNGQSKAERYVIYICTQYRDSSPNAHFGTRKNTVLGEIALLEDFGTILCKNFKKSRWSEDHRRVMRIFWSLNQNRVGPNSALDEIALGEESL